MARQRLARIFAFSEFELDERCFELCHRGHRVDVQPKVLKLLFYLIEHRERVVPIEELLHALWPNERVTVGSVRRAVTGARRALHDMADAEPMIRAVTGFGYQFTARVAEKQALETSTPPPPNALDAPAEVFIGRDGPLALLESSLADSLGNQGRIALISGSPGIGKSSLLHEFVARARSRGIEAHCGRCLEAEGAPALWPWLQVLREYAQHRDRAELEAMMGGRAADIAQAVPEIAEWLGGVPAPPRIDSVQARFRFFDGVVGFLRRVAERSGLVLAFDDLQRADSQSLRLLIFLTKRLESSRILLVATLRALDEVADERRELLAELTREDPTRCFELSGFTRDDVARYASLALGATPPDAAVDAVHRQTAGNPLFCAQIVRTWQVELQADGSRDLRGLDPIPRSLGLRAAIDRHLQVLSAECRSLLRIAAVQGREFCLGLLDSPDHDETRLPLLLSEALRAGIVRQHGGELGQYVFTHVLIRDALCEEVAADRRAQLHAGIGAALESRYPEAIGRRLPQLSHHFFQAAPTHDEGRALKYALLAGHYALKHLAFEEAALDFKKALRLLELGPLDPQQRFDVLMSQGEALRHARDARACREVMLEAAALARAFDSADAITRVALEFARHLETGRVDLERVGLLRQALTRLPATDRRRPLLQGQLARSLLFAGNLAERSRLAREALAGAKTSDDVAIAAETLKSCHEALLEPQYLEERRSASAELVRLASRHGEDEWLLQGCVTQVQDAMALGDMQTVDAAIQMTATLAAKVRQPMFLWYAVAFRATRAAISGNFELADSLAHEALRFGMSIGEEHVYHSYCCQATLVWSWQGRLAQVEPLLRDISARYPALSGWRALLATTELNLGRPERARAVLAELVDDDLRVIRAEPFMLAALAPAADLCALVGNADQSRALYEAMLPYEHQHGVVALGMSHHGPIARYLGILAQRLREPQRARQHFEQALTMAQRMPSPPFTALTSYQLALSLGDSKQAGDRARARELLAGVVSLADGHKLRWLSKAAGNALTKATTPGDGQGTGPRARSDA